MSYNLKNTHTQTQNDNDYHTSMKSHFEMANGSTTEKLSSFSRFVSRQDLSTFLVKNEIFQKIVHIHGNIVECGVFRGSGLFTWAQLSSIYEPYNHNRKILGFDTFSGFPSLSANDESTISEHKEIGAYYFDGMTELKESIKLFDLNRPIGHIQKIELIQGDATISIPSFINENPHFVVSLLYLDFDLYEPTKTAIESFLPRMPKGAIICFDELNQKQWPGETLALMETIGINNLKIERFPFMPQISYAIL